MLFLQQPRADSQQFFFQHHLNLRVVGISVRLSSPQITKQTGLINQPAANISPRFLFLSYRDWLPRHGSGPGSGPDPISDRKKINSRMAGISIRASSPRLKELLASKRKPAATFCIFPPFFTWSVHHAHPLTGHPFTFAVISSSFLIGLSSPKPRPRIRPGEWPGSCWTPTSRCVAPSTYGSDPPSPLLWLPTNSPPSPHRLPSHRRHPTSGFT